MDWKTGSWQGVMQFLRTLGIPDDCVWDLVPCCETWYLGILACCIGGILSKAYSISTENMRYERILVSAGMPDLRLSLIQFFGRHSHGLAAALRVGSRGSWGSVLETT